MSRSTSTSRYLTQLCHVGHTSSFFLLCSLSARRRPLDRLGLESDLLLAHDVQDGEAYREEVRFDFAFVIQGKPFRCSLPVCIGDIRVSLTTDHNLLGVHYFHHPSRGLQDRMACCKGRPCSVNVKATAERLNPVFIPMHAPFMDQRAPSSLLCMSTPSSISTLHYLGDLGRRV